MSERGMLVLGTAFAAVLVGCFGLSVFSLWAGGLHHLVDFAVELLVLAIMPTVVSATTACVWVSGSNRFASRGDFSNAARITLLAYPILFFVLWATIWIWLQFYSYLPPHERPGTLSRMAGTSADYSLFAVIFGALPAMLIEYAVVRLVRGRFRCGNPGSAVNAEVPG